MYVTFINNRLHVIKYFYDTRPPAAANPDESTRGECQFTGKWETYSGNGGKHLVGNFYSTQWDMREEIVPNEAIGKYRGFKVDVTKHAGQLWLFATCIGVGTTAHFFNEYEIRTTNSRGMELAYAIQQGDRCSYAIGKKTTMDQGTIRTGGEGGGSVNGPRTEYWELYHFLAAWVGGCYIYCEPGARLHLLTCVAVKQCQVVTESCVTDDIIGDFYSEACTGKFKLPGDWNRAPKIPPSWSNTEVLPQRTECDIRLINNTGFGEIILKQEIEEGTTEGTTMSSWWFKASPDPDTSYIPTFKATHSCIGVDGVEVANFMDDFDGNLKHAGGPDSMKALWNACYTGVIE